MCKAGISFDHVKKDLMTDDKFKEEYNNIMENIYVMGNKSNYDWLMQSKAQLEKGKLSAETKTKKSVSSNL